MTHANPNLPPGSTPRPPRRPLGPGDPRFAPRVQDPGWSMSAILGFVASLLGCIPFIASAVAVVLSIIGLRQTRSGAGGNVRGGAKKGFALALVGLILGVLGLLGWTAAGGLTALLYFGSTDQREVGRNFAFAITAGDIERTMQLSHPQMNREEITASAGALNDYGTLRSVRFKRVEMHTGTAGRTTELRGWATFDGGRCAYEVHLQRMPDGSWVVMRYNFGPLMADGA